ncbi:hypothetical protein BJX70DRAFT_373895 [Aspergillus crustosus]
MASVRSALEVITFSDLSPTEHLLLKLFVNSAAEPERAANYVLSNVEASIDSVEDLLREIKRRWRTLASLLTTPDPIPEYVRDLAFRRKEGDGYVQQLARRHPGANVEPAYVIPPSLVDALELEKHQPLVPLLEAFISPSGVSRLRGDKLKDDSAHLKNVLLLSPTIHNAFRAGHVDLRTRSQLLGRPVDEPEDGNSSLYIMTKVFPEEVSGLFMEDNTPFDDSIEYFTFSTSDPEHLCLPSCFLIDIHHKFARAMHQFFVEDKIALGWPETPNRLSLPTFITSALTSLWLRLPQWLRVRCYVLLQKLGRKLYPLEATVWAQRLPFGLYIKQCSRAPHNEPNVLKLIKDKTTIPAPLLIDTWEYDGTVNILMTRLQGTQIGYVYHLMSYAERNQFSDDLRNCVDQLRKLENTTPYLICDSLGGPIVDHRIPSGTGGPWKTEADFNEHLTSHVTASFSKVVELKDLPVREHKNFYFSHSDFHPSNLLVHRGRLSGIVDWESGGFRPEYWEFTKAIYGTLGGEVMGSIFRRTFGKVYETELEVERRLWFITPLGS